MPEVQNFIQAIESRGLSRILTRLEDCKDLKQFALLHEALRRRLHLALQTTNRQELPSEAAFLPDFYNALYFDGADHLGANFAEALSAQPATEDQSSLEKLQGYHDTSMKNHVRKIPDSNRHIVNEFYRRTMGYFYDGIMPNLPENLHACEKHTAELNGLKQEAEARDYQLKAGEHFTQEEDRYSRDYQRRLREVFDAYKESCVDCEGMNTETQGTPTEGMKALVVKEMKQKFLEVTAVINQVDALFTAAATDPEALEQLLGNEKDLGLLSRMLFRNVFYEVVYGRLEDFANIRRRHENSLANNANRDRKDLTWEERREIDFAQRALSLRGEPGHSFVPSYPSHLPEYNAVWNDEDYTQLVAALKEKFSPAVLMSLINQTFDKHEVLARRPDIFPRFKAILEKGRYSIVEEEKAAE